MREIGKHLERDDSRDDEKEMHDDVQETVSNHTHARIPFVFGA
jgi:hypothetical protein